MPFVHSERPLVMLGFPGMAPAGAALALTPVVRVGAETDAARVPGLLVRAEEWAKRGLHVAGWVSYEAAPAFDSALRVRPRESHDPPLAWFAAAEDLAETALAVDHSGPPVEWRPHESSEGYSAAVERIRELIASGGVYQVNHTTRLRAHVAENPLALFARLCARQKGSYSALIDTGSHRIISVSPELFFERDSERMTTRPMKGTAPRGRWPDEDDRIARELAASEKERAENLMIVDLLRNDLGKLAKPGTVRVTRLLDVERYETVWQMTSTVEACISRDATLCDCFGALFPSGSVTGAPKVAAMGRITELENSPRGPYCGAIGYIAPGGRATFSVAIRTLVQNVESGDAVYGSGGGITWDSDPSAEYAEMLRKARVLGAAPREFSLLETMRLEGSRAVRLDRHLARLAESARYFGFSPPVDACEAIERAARAAPDGVHRLRLTADRAGSVAVELFSFDERRPAEPQPVVVAKTCIDSSDPLIYHKTTARAGYESAKREARGAFDVILWNERHEATELTIGNLVAELDGELVTPARECGLLAGVFRQELLDAGVLRESVIPLEELRRASRLWMVNSLREWVQIRLEE